MRRRIIGLCLGAAITIASAAACNTETSGVPTGSASVPPSQTSATTPGPSTADTAAQLPADGAPPVDTPLDPSRFRADPCQTLTASQTQELGVTTPGHPGEGAFGSECTWQNSDSGSSIDLQFGKKDADGLSGLYRAHKQNDYAYFTELSAIQNHPAVAASPQDDRPDGGCTVYVGLTNQQIFQVATVQSSNKVGTTDPCTVAATVADKLMQTLKAGA